MKTLEEKMDTIIQNQNNMMKINDQHESNDCTIRFLWICAYVFTVYMVLLTIIRIFG
jgi:hypothetical protein